MVVQDLPVQQDLTTLPGDSMVAQIKARLAAIEVTYPPTPKAFSEGPVTLPEDLLPVWVNFATGGTYEIVEDDGSSRLVIIKRNFLARLYVANVQAGVDGEAELKTEQHIEPASKLFLARPFLSVANFGPLSHVFSAKSLGDGGIQVMPYGPKPAVPFLGTEHRIEVIYQIRVSYASGN